MLTDNKATILSGKPIAASIQKRICESAVLLEKHIGRKPGLGVVIVGDNQASKIYVANKVTAAKKCKIESIVSSLPSNASSAEIEEAIKKLGANKDIDGIILQLPLPDYRNPERLINAIPPNKDVDGLTLKNIGSLWSGKSAILRPCTPSGVMKLLQEAIKPKPFDLSGMKAVVIGRSRLVGRPLATMLLQKNASVSICHKLSGNDALNFYTKNAEIIIAAAGAPGLVKKEMVKKGSIVIDIGITRLANGKIVGDVDFKEVSKVARVITPVPGGVGPMTISYLLYNTVVASAIQANVYGQVKEILEG